MITRTISALAIALAITCASAANAQQPAPGATSQGTPPLGDKLLVAVNVGAQTRSSTASRDFTFPVYGQTAAVTTSTSVDGGPIFDVSGTYRFMPKFGVGVGYSAFSKTGTAQGAASIPSPVFFNQPAAVAINAINAKHTENNVYIVAAGYLPITNVVDLSVFIGPSFTRVKQDLINSVSVPAGTQNVVSAAQSESGTAKGVNVGADLSYRFTKLVGAGAFIRYNGGSVDLPSLTDVKAGGFQVGIGARLHF
ncbi:MAG TPA: outer membrane beta-barrel protein [Vicinamibacterales bacterium]|nr:outer membrane beta-barrel protein [Vicinamibacterales bacterium]